MKILRYKPDGNGSAIFLQTEVLKQLSSMGRLVVCAGDGAVQSSTNLYEYCFQWFLNSPHVLLGTDNLSSLALVSYLFRLAF